MIEKAALPSPWKEEVDKWQREQDMQRRLSQQCIPPGYVVPAPTPATCSGDIHVGFCSHCGTCKCGNATLNRDQFGPQPPK